MKISDKQLFALKFIIDLLNEANIRYQITGGLAGNIYGSNWPLQDIDIEASAADMILLAAMSKLKSYIVAPLRQYQDSEFQMTVLNLRVEDVPIDISQTENLQIRSNGKWIELPTDLSRAHHIKWHDLMLSVQPPSDIIHDKTLLGRTIDQQNSSSFAIPQQQHYIQ